MRYILLTFLIVFLWSCQDCSKVQNNIPQPPEGMVWVAPKIFMKGAKENDRFAIPREKPAHEVKVDGFFIDITEVTNKEFKTFVEETGYTTFAERPIDWEDLKRELPPNTPKPADSLLRPGSLVFNKNAGNVQNLNYYQQWWTWQVGANWKHPEGPASTIEGKENYPVVHIAYEDALAYCKWASRRLPTEAEWEAAALGKNENSIYTWGNDKSGLIKNANTWQGEFPNLNLAEDGFQYAAPVKSFPPNSLGIYDMMGNVWELTSDFFNVDYYKTIDTSQPLDNPKGADSHYDPNNPFEVQHVIKGGSFLCHESYCASFRISARMGVGLTSSSDHTGFRTVATPKMLGK